MKISELVDALNGFKERHGDLSIYIFDGEPPQPIVMYDYTDTNGLVLELWPESVVSDMDKG